MRSDLVEKFFEGGKRHKTRQPKLAKRLDTRVDWEEVEPDCLERARVSIERSVPSYRFGKKLLGGHVGKPWNTVVSEFVKNAQGPSKQAFMVRDALRWMVTNERVRKSGDRVQCVAHHCSVVYGLYVDNYGILRKAPERNYARGSEVKPVTEYPYKDGTTFELVDFVRRSICGCSHFTAKRRIWNEDVIDKFRIGDTRPADGAVCLCGNPPIIESVWLLVKRWSVVTSYTVEHSVTKEKSVRSYTTEHKTQRTPSRKQMKELQSLQLKGTQ